MEGYFIQKDKAEKLGLLDNHKIVVNLQKVIIAFTVIDVQNNAKHFGADNFELSDKKITDYANWFYKNYYDAFLESFLEHAKVKGRYPI